MFIIAALQFGIVFFLVILWTSRGKQQTLSLVTQRIAEARGRHDHAADA